jgi:hypothetical protein
VATRVANTLNIAQANKASVFCRFSDLHGGGVALEVQANEGASNPAVALELVGTGPRARFAFVHIPA